MAQVANFVPVSPTIQCSLSNLQQNQGLYWDGVSKFKNTNNLTPSGAVYTDASGNINSLSLANGQSLIGQSSGNPVAGTPIQALANLSDVSLTSLGSNQGLQYNGTKWGNINLQSGFYNATATGTTNGSASSINGTFIVVGTVCVVNFSLSWSGATPGSMSTVHLSPVSSGSSGTMAGAGTEQLSSNPFTVGSPILVGASGQHINLQWTATFASSFINGIMQYVL